MKRNKTFTTGPNMHMNACVGNNTGGESDIGYRAGFAEAVNVMLAVAKCDTYRDPETGEEKAVNIDGLIYPICFCARHFIELFLKRQIAIVGSLRDATPAVPVSHDLGDLWDDLEAKCLADRQLNQLLKPIKEYVDDFATVDSSGQTFRYQYDNTGEKKHLTELGGVINIESLSKRFKELQTLIEEFEVYSELIQNEYLPETYTKKLSPNELRELAVALPGKEQWGGAEFLSVKQAFVEKYSLSANDFCRAIDLVKSRRELSIEVGVEIPLGQLSSEIFARIKNFDKMNPAASNFSRVELASLHAICEVGKSYEPAAAYDGIYQFALPDDSEQSLYAADIVRVVISHVNGRFRTGLRKLGQATLLKEFDLMFPPAAPLTEEERKAKQEEASIQLKKLFHNDDDEPESV